MSHDYVPRMINLERSDYQIVRQMAEERGLGEKGLSAAVRMIIREWQGFQLQELNRTLQCFDVTSDNITLLNIYYILSDQNAQNVNVMYLSKTLLIFLN